MCQECSSNDRLISRAQRVIRALGLGILSPFGFRHSLRSFSLRVLGRTRLVACGTMLLLLAAGVETSRSQVVLDGKFGASGALAGPNYTVTAGMGATRGNNLFHSFTQFDLKSGDVATFTGPANIQNILRRVTSGSPSST